MNWLILFGFLAVAALAERKRFDGCEVWHLQPEDKAQLEELHNFYELHNNDNDKKAMFWEEPGRVKQKAEILVCQEGKDELRTFMQLSKISGKVISTELQSHLDAVWAADEARHDVSTYAYSETNYNTFEDIMSQMNVLRNNCPQGVTCTVENIGTSLEQRPITVFRISKPGQNRRGIFLDSLIHSREWLAGTTLMGILHKLINEYGSNPQATYLVDTYNFHIVPVMNPDGYVYTWNTDRFWRKNRRNNAGSSCDGVDLNRNYDYEWGEGGSSGDPCNDGYRGASVASEPETQVIQAEGERLSDELFLWVTYHTVAELYLFPYGLLDTPGWICRRAPNHEDLNQAGQAAVAAIQGTYNEGSWESGNTCETLYPVSGSTMDWARGNIVTYSYTPELRGPGFDPPTNVIEKSTEENWNGLVAMISEIESIGRF